MFQDRESLLRSDRAACADKPPAAILHSGLWPSVDPVFSRSSLLRADAVGEARAKLANRALRLLRRYRDLPDADDPYRFEVLHAEDQRTAIRARRLQ